jgi:hypothetical protein
MMTRQIDCLLATGSEVLAGPQFLAPSTILALALHLVSRGQRTAILVIDPALDPALVSREESDGVIIYRSAEPISTLPALSLALGGPRILLLPNHLASYDPLQVPALDLVAWLGEDDLAFLADRGVTAPIRFWADSRYVAGIAGGLLQAVRPMAPPAGPRSSAIAPSPDPTSIAVVGARPRDGIALTLALARRRRDLRFVIVEWPRLSPGQRRQVFALAQDCGNIDWRRPDGPGDLLAALATAQVILVPAQRPIGHRDWIRQMQGLGRHLLVSDQGALPDLIAVPDCILPATAAPDIWLRHLDPLRRTTCPPALATATEAGLREIADAWLSRAD